MTDSSIHSIITSEREGALRVLKNRRRVRTQGNLARAGEFVVDAICCRILERDAEVVDAVFSALSCLGRAVSSHGALLREGPIARGEGLLDRFALADLRFLVPCAVLTNAKTVLRGVEEAWLKPASELATEPTGAMLVVASLRALLGEPGDVACRELDELLVSQVNGRQASDESLLFARGVGAAQAGRVAECEVVLREMAELRLEALRGKMLNPFEFQYGSILGERECVVATLAIRNGVAVDDSLYCDQCSWPRYFEDGRG